MRDGASIKDSDKIGNIYEQIKSNNSNHSNRNHSNNNDNGVDDDTGTFNRAIMFILSILPIDTNILMRKDKNIKKFVTYEAWKIKDKEKILKNKQNLINIKKDEIQNKIKKDLLNQDAYKKWCINKKHVFKLIPINTIVRLNVEDFECQLFAPNDISQKAVLMLLLLFFYI
mmetsp:Transcript_10528/g.13804  ORF Transcript_10528/g.13804 Transcript_10528/m.13804 type:complete len:171 (+) Transcript_10528:501-1013(+)